MNIKVAVLGMMVACVAGSAMAQENDDMYFNSKDRAKLNEKLEKVAAQKKTETLAYNDRDEEATTSPEDDNINTTDYSARNLNPEYVSRSNSELAQEDDQNYFVNDYRFANSNNLNQFSNNYNNWYNSNRWYNSGYYSNSMSGFNSSPYYYNSFANPWCSPYYQSGWYGGLSFYSGSPYYGNSWGGGYNGWGYDPWSSPYAYGGYGGYYGGGYGSYWGGYNNYWGGGRNVVIINEGSGRGQVYGKRPERGGMVYHPSNSTPNRRSEVGSRGNNGGASSGGRVSTATNTGRTQDEYYNRSWRRASDYGRGTSNSNSSWNNGSSNSGRSNSGWSNGNSSSTPSRSSDNGGSRSWGGNSGSSSHSSSGSSSGSSGGRTRSH